MTAQALLRRVDELRREFDDSFAVATLAGDAQADDLLVIRLRGDPHLIRLADVGRLLRAGALLRYSSSATAWLGLAGVAGNVVPVYDLGLLVGYRPAAPPGWVAVCAAAPVALAFDSFDGQVRHMCGHGPDGVPSNAPPGRFARIAGESCPIIDVGALVERLRASAAVPAQTASPTPTPPPVGG